MEPAGLSCSARRSQLFLDSPWTRYLAGDDRALSADAKQGAMLFLTSVEDGQWSDI